MAHKQKKYKSGKKSKKSSSKQTQFHFQSYNILGKKGEGTFSLVLHAQHKKSGKYVAIKCMRNVFDSIDQVNRLREIQALQRLALHGNIIQLLEVLYDDDTHKLALVFELMDMNMYDLIKKRKSYLPTELVQSYMYQMCKSMAHMHRHGIFHRDIKPENLLIMGDKLKLADFGSCRGIYSKQPYTEYISTRWYRAPECLLTDGYYSYKMDMWGVGCVFFEIVSLYALFPGKDEVDQIDKIHNVLGTPSPEVMDKFRVNASEHVDLNFEPKKGSGLRKLLPKSSPVLLDLLEKLLAYNPEDRITARQALRHPYFKELRDADRAATRSRVSVSSHNTNGSTDKPTASSKSKNSSGNKKHSSSTVSIEADPARGHNAHALPKIKASPSSKSYASKKFQGFHNKPSSKSSMNNSSMHSHKSGRSKKLSSTDPVNKNTVSLPSVFSNTGASSTSNSSKKTGPKRIRKKKKESSQRFAYRY